ncbi:hypothetical protein ASZ78_001830 [Callipepla squamata]|uniref:PPIase cyclophilin-type domain-containing protein n=1 Tax=Callipepla squamata TaxID=9009 RepID=A0A226ND70_CALSU|nr:hypothetical protein ASZ78_001830 [Callipepla squamata]
MGNSRQLDVVKEMQVKLGGVSVESRTTKPAPHLDGVHVVFGLVISGFEVIEQIENLKTDTASRPYADVRVIDCGVLTTKPAKDALEKKKQVCSDSEASDSSSSGSGSSETSSESEAEDERSRRRKRKRRAKTKQSRKRRKEEKKKEDLKSKRTSNQRCLSEKSDATEKAADVSTKRDKPVVRPEEIPPVPENRFLLRRDVPVISAEPEPKLLDATPVLADQKPSVSKSGRKIKGRGTIVSVIASAESGITPHHDHGRVLNLMMMRAVRHLLTGKRKCRDYERIDHLVEKSGVKAISKIFNIHPEETGLNLTRKTRVHRLSQAKRVGHTTGPGPDPDLDLSQGLIPKEVPDRDQPLNHRVLEAVILPSDKVIIPPVVPESLPVIPLSDSPPPSRWKPGQKPWKPSYERIQEMKAKATHLIPPQTNYNLVVIKEANTSSSQKRQGSSDSDRSAYSKYRSDKSSDSWQRSRSRSSRSRSYSRSYTRSRSLSSSRTKSRSSGRSPSVNKYRSDRSGYSESTSYFSLSDDDRHRSKRKSTSGDQNTRSLKARQETSSESTLPYKGVKDYDESSQGLKESDSLSSSDFSTDSERSGKAKGAPEKEGHFQLEGGAQQQDKNTFHSVRGEEKSKRKWDAEHSKKKAVKEQSSEQPRGGAKSKQKSYSGSKWDSESNSERGEAHRSRGDSRPSSDKEEGEATSGSDTEHSVSKRRKTKSNSSEGVLDSDRTWKMSKQLSSSESESSRSNSTRARGKSKKHKHDSKKNLKKSHSKKAKEKSKGKKEKKHKVQKRKEVFHWQPPLEFGEEDEEDINEKPVIKDDKEKQLTRGAKDKKQQADEKDEIVQDKTGNDEKPCADENLLVKNATSDASPNQNKLNKDSINPNTSASVLNSGINVTTCNNEAKHGEESNENGLDVIQTDDNMEICTPDRNSPGKVVVDALSPVILTDKPQSLGASINKDLQTSEQDAVKLGNNIADFINIKEEIGRQENSSAPASSAKDCSLKNEIAENTQSNSVDNKWKPLQGVGNLQPATISTATEVKNVASAPEAKPAGLRIEIKAKNKVRPGSLFDEVRKTARLNRRPRNQESSSEEESPSRDDNSPSRSLSRSRSQEAIQEAEAEAGTAGTGQEAGVVLTTVTRVVVVPIVEADPEAVLMVTTVDPVGHTPMIVPIAEVEVEVKGVTAIEDLEVMTGDPDLTALIAKVIAVTLTTEVPVRAADTAENVSSALETV